MKGFIFVSLTFFVCCLARPDASHLVNSNYLPPQHEQLKLNNNEANTFAHATINKQQPNFSSPSTSLHQNENPSAQIESIQPSIHLASFSVQTTVPATQTYTQEQQSYKQYKPTQQITQLQTKDSYNYNIPQTTENDFTSASVPNQKTSYPQTTVISKEYNPTIVFQQENSAGAVLAQNYEQPNFASQQTYKLPEAKHQNYATSLQQQSVNFQQAASVEQSKIPEEAIHQTYNTVTKPPQTYLTPAVVQQNIVAPVQKQQTTHLQPISIAQTNTPQKITQQSFNSVPNSIQSNSANVEQIVSSQQSDVNQRTSHQSYNTAQIAPQNYLPPPPAIQQNYAQQLSQQPANFQQTFLTEQTNAEQETYQQSYNTAQIPSQNYVHTAQQTYFTPTQEQSIISPHSVTVEQTKSTPITHQNSLKTAENIPQTVLLSTAAQQNYASSLQKQPTAPSQLYIASQTVSDQPTHIPISPQFYNPPRNYLTPVTIHQNPIVAQQQQPVVQVQASDPPPQIIYSSSNPNAPIQATISQSATQTLNYAAPYIYQPSNNNNLQSSYPTPATHSNFNPNAKFNVQTSHLAQQNGLNPGQSYHYKPSHTIHSAPITPPAQLSQPAYDFKTSSIAPLQQTQIIATPAAQAAVQLQTQSITNQNFVPTTSGSYNYNTKPVTVQYQQPSPAIKQSYSQVSAQNVGTNLPAFIETPQPKVSGIQSNQPTQTSAVISYNYKERPVSHFQVGPETSSSTENSGSYNYLAPSTIQQEIVSNHNSAITTNKNLHESQPVQKIELSITSASAPFLTEIRTPIDTEYDQNGGYIYRRH